MGLPPLTDNCLIAWRIIGGSTASTSPSAPSALSRVVGILRCSAAMMVSGEDSATQVNVSIVCDYFAFLFDKGLSLRMIKLHHSVLSATLPPLEGVDIGHHPVVSRLIQGVFNARPPSRRLFASWDIGLVFDLFSSWSGPLSFEQLQRKTAFLLAMASSQQPSELVSLQCSSAFIIVDALKVVFFLQNGTTDSFYPHPHLSSTADGRFRRLPGRCPRVVSLAMCGAPHRSRLHL